jgi:hypothetical protein
MRELIKTITISLGCFLLMLSPILILFGFFAIPSMISEFRLTQSLTIFDGAEKIHERTQLYGAGSATKYLYYWTNEPIEIVMDYYKEFTSPFTSWEYGGAQRFRTFLDANDANKETTSGRFDDIEPHCDYRDRYDCVEMELIDADKYNLSYLDEAPDYGTIIAFIYYVVDY